MFLSTNKHETKFYLSQENQQNAWAKTKAQISFAVTMMLISAFVFTTQIVQSTFLPQNFKLLAISCNCTGQFVSDMVKKKKQQRPVFSRCSSFTIGSFGEILLLSIILFAALYVLKLLPEIIQVSRR